MFFKHLFLWVAICFAIMLAVPIIATPSDMWQNARAELQMINGAFGSHDTAKISSGATSVYNAIFVSTGLIETTQKARVSQDERELGEAVLGSPSRILTGLSNNYIDTFGALTYVVVLRLLIMLSWLPFILPFLAGAVGEGISRRRIKYATFGQYGAALYAGAAHLSVLVIVLPVLYFMAPFPVTPYFVPFWALVAALPIVVSVANASQILPK